MLNQMKSPEMEPQSQKFELELKDKVYSFIEGVDETKEAAIERLNKYAETGPECGKCEEIIFPGSPVIGGTLNGVKFTSPYIKDSEFVHFRCIDEAGPFMGWVNEDGQLTPFDDRAVTEPV